MDNKIRTIYQAIKKWAVEHPNKAALVCPGGEFISYGQLFRDIRQIGNFLRGKNIGAKDAVAIVFSRSIEEVVVNLGIASFASAVPLNPEHSQVEFEYFFKNFGIKALLTDNNLPEEAGKAAKKQAIPVIKIKTGEGGAFDGNTKKSERILNTAFLLHTSGTTGKPKIVPLSHRNLYFGAKNLEKSLKLGSCDRCLSVMPLFHVHGLMVMIATIFTGGFFVYTPKFDREAFWEWLDEFKPTWYTASAALQQYIVGRADKHKSVIKRQKLRLIRSSSAPLPKETTEKLERIFKAPVAESYGMTEAALQITSQPLPPAKRKFGSVGKPAGVEIKITDEQEKILPAGEIGEIIIRGDNVIRAYGNNPEANRKSFWRGWLKTGDLGFIDKDGFIFIKGRIKEMINKGGEKISPREIDEALLRHRAIEQAVAFSVPHKELGEDIAAAVVMKQGKKFKESEIRGFLAGELAGFKIPSRIIEADELPKTGAGKLKRVGLYEEFKYLLNPVKRPETATRGCDKKMLKNNQKTEEILIKIWQEALGVREINSVDNFFELGGDSLKAGEIISKATKLGLVIELKDLLNHPTIAGLVKFINK